MIKLVDILKEVKDELKTAYIVVANPIKEPGKPRLGKMVWGKYKDGSTIFIPYGRYTEYDSKPSLYFNIEDANKEAESLKRFYPNIVVTVEPLTGNLKEIKINAPGSLVYSETPLGSSLTVNGKYVYRNYGSYLAQQTIYGQEYIDYINSLEKSGKIEIDCVLEVEKGENIHDDTGVDPDKNYLIIYINEPSFGGGAPQEEIEAAYDEFERNLDISEEILPPYCDEYAVTDEGAFYIDMNKIIGKQQLEKYL